MSGQNITKQTASDGHLAGSASRIPQLRDDQDGVPMQGDVPLSPSQQSATNESDGKKRKKSTTVLSVDFDALLPSIGEMGRYQLGLYLLMCIPATLPAAFLAFNQVFLSASPDHWCNIPELKSSNLSTSHIKKLSIPLRDFGIEGIEYKEYERCLQYDVNYTQIYHDNGQSWPTEANESWPKTTCRNGWVYDRSEYQDTLVTEVSSPSHKINYIAAQGIYLYLW